MSDASGPQAISRAWCITRIMCSIAALTWLLIARVLGPSDLWDQTQVKTVSYTTDIIVHGGMHWILPIERGELPATKPPLYNWLAVPFVKGLGFDCEIAHKVPSIAALIACWAILVRLGNRLERALVSDSPIAGRIDRHQQPSSLGWLASLTFIANAMIFKLGYLARPDMLLTLWLLIAWTCATRAFVDAAAVAADDRRRSIRTPVLFWMAVTLAALTKGPAALIAIAYAIIAARFIGGRWSAIRSLHPFIGVLVCVLVCGAWVYGVWKINPQHLQQELWFNEIYGRVTGTGEEGTDHGRRQWLIELPYQLFYFVTRFAPWSLVSLIGVMAVTRRGMPGASPLAPWMRGAALQMIITISLYSLSVGKRADYIAGAIPPAALLAAWWFLHHRPHLALRWPWLAPATAALVLAALTWHNQRETAAPVRGFGDAIMRFAHDANRAIAAQPARVITFAAGQTHLQAMMGIAEPDARRDLPDLIRAGNPLWVLAGRTQNAPHELDKWLAQHRLNAEASPVARSAVLPREEGWPEQVTLWRIAP